MFNFGSVLQERRKALHLTQQQLADRVGTTRDTVARWERGAHPPRYNHVRRLGEALDQDPLDARWPVSPQVTRQLLSARRAELLTEQPDLVRVEPDPFAWRLRQVLGWRGLDPWSFAKRMGVPVSALAAWRDGTVAPDWPQLWRAADLLDVPVWWWRCGGEEEQAMYGPFELRAEDSGTPTDEADGWAFVEMTADRYGIPISDVVRTAYPHWAGWRWRERLEDWEPAAVPELPVTARLQEAARRRCAAHGEDVSDVGAWLCDLCGVSALTASRWISGERSRLTWRHGNLAAAALEIPAWTLWAPVEQPSGPLVA